MKKTEEIKDKLYEDLESLIASVPKEDKLVILGDFNASGVADYQTWDGVIGRNGFGKSNSSGHLLLKTCAAHDLLITNTDFNLPNHNKTSWMHPCSKHWHLIDYVKNLIEYLDSKLDQLSFGTNGAEEDCAAFRDVFYNTALAHLDQNTRKHQDWFNHNDEDIQKLLDEKCEAFRSLQQDTSSVSKKAAYNSIKSKVQAKLRERQDPWLSRKEDEIQKYADSNNTKCFYNALMTI
ncbi:hypothetical protein NDU88_004663 [Pleurodeles waltl]|uniref:Endonuclease/exonuclease/phosphatase domain-containing protein n=1 Tax=Pleurodeles waltl TaxID=8319 RepID=A0AAV7QG76_PLEWA|nr:hypothetical protein NDU88_004663 [Pleurodeles waltl]